MGGASFLRARTYDETSFHVILVSKGARPMVKVKMNVQTAYHGDLLRAGKIYEIDETTAERWIASKIAEKAEDK